MERGNTENLKSPINKSKWYTDEHNLTEETDDNKKRLMIKCVAFMTGSMCAVSQTFKPSEPCPQLFCVVAMTDCQWALENNSVMCKYIAVEISLVMLTWYNALATRIAISVRLPASFMPCPSDLPIPFPTWLKMFNNYILVINATGNSWPKKDIRRSSLCIWHWGT